MISSSSRPSLASSDCLLSRVLCSLTMLHGCVNERYDCCEGIQNSPPVGWVICVARAGALRVITVSYRPNDFYTTVSHLRTVSLQEWLALKRELRRAYG